MDEKKVHEADASRSIDPVAIKTQAPQTLPLQNTPDVPSVSSLNNPPTAAAPTSLQQFVLDQAEPLDPRSFPNPPRNGSTQVPATIPNVKFLLKSYGILARYNVIKKKLSISVPGMAGSPDNADSVALSYVISLASLNNIPIGQIANYVEVVADQHLYNPVANWINSKPWDGIDRLLDFYDTLPEAEDFSATLKQQLMHRWLISSVAAALLPNGLRARGVLTLQGPQSIGKTAWVKSLVPDDVLQDSVIKLDHHLDAHNKDSLLSAISHWIVEIGELDSSFKKDIARLKGFLTSDRDKVRRPYGRTDSEYPRRTVFCATVNEHNFLIDITGNTRWWVIPVVGVNYKHDIDMQQLLAQVAVDFHSGEPWWLTQAEEQLLEDYNQRHRSISAIRERVLGALDLEHIEAANLPAMTPTELLRELDIDNPTNPQSKECAAVLRECLGEPKRIKGQNKWRVPLKKTGVHRFTPAASDDNLY